MTSFCLICEEEMPPGHGLPIHPRCAAGLTPDELQALLAGPGEVGSAGFPLAIAGVALAVVVTCFGAALGLIAWLVL
jgi:hypothetical protein